QLSEQRLDLDIRQAVHDEAERLGLQRRPDVAQALQARCLALDLLDHERSRGRARVLGNLLKGSRMRADSSEDRKSVDIKRHRWPPALRLQARSAMAASSLPTWW